MKVKTFVGTNAPEVDKQVNDWLAESKVQVRRTSTAFKRFRDRGKDAITGRTVARHGVCRRNTPRGFSNGSRR
jgi:hypothetical protein